MESRNKGYSSIDEYIQSFPPNSQIKLNEMRQIIKKSAPEAVEKISYLMPTFYFHGNLVHFAAYAKHIGFYPGANGISQFKNELKSYKSAKGSVQFPLEQPLPLDIIRKIVEFRVEENRKKAQNQRSRT
ncbi:MAG TPA: DUF1801 domain-containing protein [Spirochaetia bacterium]|nr:DUF1801 domain-containing protein [Spirochaetia bacterium]